MFCPTLAKPTTLLGGGQMAALYVDVMTRLTMIDWIAQYPVLHTIVNG